MNRKSQIGILLKGGLGNQLFQLSAGLYCSKGEPIGVFNNFTQPRQTDGLADALYFAWPPEVFVNNSRSNRAERKVLAISLRVALIEKRLVRVIGLFKPLGLLVNTVLSITFKKRTHVYSGDGVGFCEVNLKPGLNLLNGYFQGHQFPYHPIVQAQMKEIRLKQISPRLNQWIEKIKKENPIIVHLRLGDYKNESGIGLLPPCYYEEALQIMESSVLSKNIWIFTDEAESVSEFVSPSPNFRVSIIGEIGLNSAETLELMRYGSGYVIANSTFSWWAAFLSYQSGCTTIMPAPWFQKKSSPIGIKPHDWTEIEFLKH